MKKIMKKLLILVLIVFFILITFLRFVDEKNENNNDIGNIWNGNSISTVNHAIISELYNKYLTCIQNDEYEVAYKMLSSSYAEYKDYNAFLEEIGKYDYKNAKIEKIIRRTEYMYSIFLISNDLQKENLLVFNKDNTICTIRPETFLEHVEYEKLKIKKGKVEYTLLDTVNYVDKYVAKINITNSNKNKTVTISNIILRNNAEKINGNFSELIIEPNESKIIEVQFETFIDFPDQIEIQRYIEKKDSVEKHIFNLD